MGPDWRLEMGMIERDRLRAGIFLPPFHPNDEDPLLCFDRDFELVAWLDRLGFDEAWIGEHHSGSHEAGRSPSCRRACEEANRGRLASHHARKSENDRHWHFAAATRPRHRTDCRLAVISNRQSAAIRQRYEA